MLIHLVPDPEGTFKVNPTNTRPKITVTADGSGLVSHVGSRLLADVADRSTLTGELSEALRKPRTTQIPGEYWWISRWRSPTGPAPSPTSLSCKTRPS